MHVQKYFQFVQTYPYIKDDRRKTAYTLQCILHVSPYVISSVLEF